MPAPSCFKNSTRAIVPVSATGGRFRMSSNLRDNYRWAVVAMLWFVCFFNYADRQAIFSVFPVLKTEMHLSDEQLGIVGGAFMWVYAISAPFAGMIADRFQRKSLILGGLL